MDLSQIMGILASGVAVLAAFGCVLVIFSPSAEDEAAETRYWQQRVKEWERERAQELYDRRIRENRPWDDSE